MTDKEGSGTDAGRKGVQTSAIFALEHLVRPDYRAAVVTRVLTEFRSLPHSTREALKSAVNETVSLSTGGFRRGRAGQALERTHTILQEPITQEIRLSDKLASAVLRGWAESHPALRQEITRHLESRGLDADGPDFTRNRFITVWEPNQWEAEWEAFTEAHGQFSKDDSGLMLCYVSGKLPALESGDELSGSEISDVLSATIDCLRLLPATAPDWQEVIPNFIESVSNLVKEKEAELKWADDFDAVLQSLRDEFAELLAFFEQDTQEWAAARVSPQADTAAALRSAERLRALLAEYRPVHDRAPGISEERERIRKRDELQPPILETAQEIDRLMTEPPVGPGPNRPAPPEPDAPDSGAAPDTPPQTAAPTPEPEPAQSQAGPPQESRPAAEPAPAEPPALPEPPGVPAAEHAALQSENRDLRDTVAALQSENRALRDEVEIIKSELYDSQEMEESWRLAYLSEKGGISETDDDTAPQVENVNAAVEMARQRFKKELTFAPNSASNIESNPYNRPEKVWDALQWLATTYYKSKMGQLRITNFDQSIKEACGWWYKGDQGETTLSRYKKSYTAIAYGKTYWLAEHIGKGTNFDARYTIRIAFDWDDDLRQVIVGYIGRHQQTDAS